MSGHLSEKFTVSMERIHRNTDITVVHDLLSPEECQHLIDLAEPELARSATFSSGNDSRRTSFSYTLMKHQDDPVVQKIIYRCAVICGYPLIHVEIPQVVRYRPGEKFVSHADNFGKDSAQTKNWGQRDFTFFVYLNEPDAEDPSQTGGTTKFTHQDVDVSPKQGSAAYWCNIKIPTSGDEEYAKIAHSGEPTENWIKYGLNVWIRHKPWGCYQF